MDKSKSLIIIVAVLFLSFVAYNRFSLPLDTAFFNPDSLYRGTRQSANIDPKDYYNKLHGLTYSDNEEDLCNPIVKFNVDNKTIRDNGNLMFIPYNESNTDYASVIGREGEGLFKNKDIIIMPTENLGFKNSNKLNSSLERNTNGRHDIDIVQGLNIIIVFEDVMTWWCHNHNPDGQIQHDQSIGNHSQSYISYVRPGAIIGTAKESTKIKVYRVKSDYLAQDINGINIDTKLGLEQIHAGKFLTQGIEEVISQP